jgi:hypothetical protein
MNGTAIKRLFVATFPPADVAASLRTAVERLRMSKRTNRNDYSFLSSTNQARATLSLLSQIFSAAENLVP